MDSLAQSVLAPLIRLSDLRDQGITLCQSLDDDNRSSLQEVPALYLVQPSKENILRICQEMRSGFYNQYLLNFVTSIDREQLERLAEAAAASGLHNRVPQVMDQYMHFACIEGNLFTVPMMTDSYSKMRNERETLIHLVVETLYCVLISIGGSMPVILATGPLSSLIASRLDARLRDLMTSTKSEKLNEDNQAMFPSHLQRPILHLLERDLDLLSPLLHPSSYNALLHEFIGIKNNVIRSGDKDYDLECEEDAFWAEHSHEDFPEATKALDTSLQQYRQEHQQITRKTGGKDLSDANSLTAEELKLAINVVPELTRRKRTIDNHIQLSSQILAELQKRHWELLHAPEHEFLANGDLEKLERTLTNPELNITDKVRMYLVALLSGKLSEEHHQRLEQNLMKQGADMKAINLLQSRRAPTSPKPNTSESSSAQLFSRMTRLVNNFLDTASSSGNLITRFADQALETLGVQRGTPNQEYLIYDPLQSDSQPQRPPRQYTNLTSSAYSAYIPFMIGGLSYDEFNALKEWSEKKNFGLVVGTTEMISGPQLLAQLSLQQ